MYLKVVVTGDGTNYNGTVSDVSTIVLAKDAPSIYPEKTTAAFGNDAATTVTLTEGQTITGVKTESGEMLTADQYTFDAETGKTHNLKGLSCRIDRRTKCIHNCSI